MSRAEQSRAEQSRAEQSRAEQRTSNKRRFKRRLKGFEKKYNRYETGLDEIKRSLSSYNGHLKQDHTYRLRRNIYSKYVLTHARKEECISTDNDVIKQ